MNKPTGYDEAQGNNSYTPVELGGHYAVIKQVSEKTASNGKPMIVVLFDFCNPDRQVGYFMNAFQNDVREEKKWDFAGTMYIMVNDYNDPTKTSKDFKSFCTCAEKSNNMSVAWGGANWGAQFKGKKIGVVYGQVEKEWNGKVSMRTNPRWFCNIDAVPNAKVPAPKYLKKRSEAPAAAPATNSQGFMNIPDDAGEEIPF